VWCLLLCTLACSPGCTRSTAAGFVPTLDIGLRLTRSAALASMSSERAAHQLAAEVHVWLSFSPQSPAAALPTPGEASGLTFVAPCDEGDSACLDEAAESEPELMPLREDVP
jgi:hypothetical protein